jgi:branched-subunit amino acid ABC-type transport system permease component
LLQLLVNSAIYAGEIAMIAVGLALTYSILRFANFAHIQLAVLGGYVSFALHEAGLWLPAAVALSCIVTGYVAVAIDRIVFHPLRDLSPEGKMIVSWGVALVLRSALAAVFGGAARVFDVSPTTFMIGGAFVSTLDLAVIGTAVVAMLALHQMLFRTRLGTGLRALADNRDLAQTRGLPPERLTGIMWFVAGAYAALGGTLFALETRLQPDMDLVILLPVFASVTLGGLGSVFGAAIGACVLSLAQNLAIGIDFGSLMAGGAWFLPSQLRDVIAVAVMVIVLCLRPRVQAGGAR